MVVICLGPVCVPVSALVPFLIVQAHQRGWLKWVDPNWFKWRWWRQKYRECAPARATHSLYAVGPSPPLPPPLLGLRRPQASDCS